MIISLLQSGESWSNHAALGYAMAAARSTGIANFDTRRLLDGMRKEFDFRSIKEAEELYRKVGRENR